MASSPPDAPRTWPTRWPAEIGRVVAATPHPDDELFCAGLLALAAAGGAEVTILCATRGEHGWLNGRRGPALEVARIRREELERSCAALGAQPPRFLDLADGGAEPEPIASAVAAARADLVVSYGPDGGYGHRDHMAVYRGVATAVAAAHRPLRWLQLAFPPNLLASFAADTARATPELIDPSIDIQSLGVRRARVDWIVDAGPVAGQVRAAVAAHASQLTEGMFLTPAIDERIGREEWYLEPAG
jgi:LmbE family N-acetylglucosaminyl deacetylase